eukprot:gene24109-59941_t
MQWDCGCISGYTCVPSCFEDQHTCVAITASPTGAPLNAPTTVAPRHPPPPPPVPSPPPPPPPPAVTQTPPTPSPPLSVA